MKKKSQAFTLIEILMVITIILILVGLVLGTSGYVKKKAARSRAVAEIQGMASACASYKADNGVDPTTKYTWTLNARLDGNANDQDYRNASRDLYEALSGDTNANGQFDAGESKGYMEFKKDMLYTPSGGGDVQYIKDPFGYSYGYSTIYAHEIQQQNSNSSSGGTPTPPTGGYNPTFDLWSTSGNTSTPKPGQPGDVTGQWVKNW